jgi:hypothetical protein
VTAHGGDALALASSQATALVDADAPPETVDGVVTGDETDRLERLHRVDAASKPLAPLPSISKASLALVGEARQTFRQSSDGDPAERILEDLVAGEVGLGHELQNLEGVATGLLVRTIDDPLLALQIIKVAREVFALSTALRRRTENTFAAIAGLRAQRVLLAGQRGRLHD